MARCRRRGGLLDCSWAPLGPYVIGAALGPSRGSLGPYWVNFIASRSHWGSTRQENSKRNNSCK
eukprot:5702090-Pyramimonas_sp.AAC.1